MITEDYVSFETAKLLKKKGFDEDIDLWYGENGEIFFQHKYGINQDWRVRQGQEVYQCPTLQMAMKWLREAHNIFIQVEPWLTEETKPKYYVHTVWCNSIPKVVYELHRKIKNTPEEACEAAIKYCLENLL